MATYGFIGLGLIGGSLARAIKQKYPESRIIAYSRSKDKLEKALADKTLDEILPAINDELGKCDIIFICTPVLTFAPILKSLKDVITPGCIITDVGSVKGEIVRAAKGAGLESSFVGGHPMTGSEKTGYENSYADLLKGCVYILTPSAGSDKDKTNKLKELLTDMGCNVVITDPQKHDKAVAGISHLPHLCAASLVNTVKKADADDKLMERFAAGGFRDSTRIAASSPEVWEQICLTNSDNICDFIDEFINELNSLKRSISSGDGAAVNKAFEDAGEYLKKMPWNK